MANNLKEWREKRRLKIRDVADLSGVSESMLSRLENGERDLSPQKKVLVARALGVRVKEIFPNPE